MEVLIMDMGELSTGILIQMGTGRCSLSLAPCFCEFWRVSPMVEEGCSCLLTESILSRTWQIEPVEDLVYQ